MSLALGKCFGLLSVASLTGFVALSAVGCGDTIIQQVGPGDAGPAATQDAKASGAPAKNADPAKKDASTDVANKDASPPPQSEDAGTDGGFTPPLPGSCLDTTPINATLFPYTKARVVAGACTAAELTSLSAYVTNSQGNISAAAWSAVVGANCAQCVFSASTAATWAPILTANNQIEHLNGGGCIEVKSGKESCGRAYQQVLDCRLKACDSQCQTDAAFDACLGETAAIFTGPCKTAFDTLNVECGANLDAYETACKGATYVFEGPIRVQCITGS